MPCIQNGFAASAKWELTHEFLGRNDRVITLDVLIESTFHAELASHIAFSTEEASAVPVGARTSRERCAMTAPVSIVADKRVTYEQKAELRLDDGASGHPPPKRA